MITDLAQLRHLPCADLDAVSGGDDRSTDPADNGAGAPARTCSVNPGACPRDDRNAPARYAQSGSGFCRSFTRARSATERPKTAFGRTVG